MISSSRIFLVLILKVIIKASIFFSLFLFFCFLFFLLLKFYFYFIFDIFLETFCSFLKKSHCILSLSSTDMHIGSRPEAGMLLGVVSFVETFRPTPGDPTLLYFSI